MSKYFHLISYKYLKNIAKNLKIKCYKNKKGEVITFTELTFSASSLQFPVSHVV